MISHTTPSEFLAIADALAGTTETPGAEPDLLKLSRYKALTKGPRSAPCIVFTCEPQRMYAGGKGAIMLLKILVESISGDEDKTPGENHAARVALVNRLFVEGKADRIAELNARAKIAVSDYGQLPSTQAADSDPTGEKLRSTFILLVAAKLVPVL